VVSRNLSVTPHPSFILGLYSAFELFLE